MIKLCGFYTATDIASFRESNNGNLFIRYAVSQKSLNLPYYVSRIFIQLGSLGFHLADYRKQKL